MDHYRKQLREKGFIVVPNLLSSEEVANYRTVLLEYFNNEENIFNYTGAGKSLPNSFGYVKGIRSLLANKKLIETLKSICGEDIVYLHHCDVHHNRLSGWHKDSTGYVKDCWEPREGKESFALYKVAFYLEDHSKDKNGLTVRIGSHLTKNMNEGEVFTIHSKAGDAIIFDQRITHVGQQFNLIDKVINRLFRNQKIRTKVSSWKRKFINEQDKISVFWGFGRDNEFSYEFSRNTIIRQNKQLGASQYEIGKVADYLEQGGMRFVDY